MEKDDSRPISYIHLFAEASDPYMSKIAMEILSGPNPSVATLRGKVSETENSLWYNAGRHHGKFAGAATHWESACWGACSKCGKRGHRTEWCRNDPVSPPDPEQAKAAGEKLKKKKKAKKVDQTNGAAATVENPVSSGSGSESEGESPTRANPPGPEDVRANRMNLAPLQVQ